MLNRSGIAKTTYASTKQILANVEFQVSVGCIVPQALGVAVGTRKIAKAGTPIVINLMNTNTAVTAAGATDVNAVLLHDVDVTTGNANGTALIFGFVNVNRVDSDVAAKITALTTNSSKVTFVKL